MSGGDPHQWTTAACNYSWSEANGRIFLGNLFYFDFQNNLVNCKEVHSLSIGHVFFNGFGLSRAGLLEK